MSYELTAVIMYIVILIVWSLKALYNSPKLKANREYKRRRANAIRGHSDYVNEQAAWFYINEPGDSED